MEKQDGRSLACGYSMPQKIPGRGMRQPVDNSFAAGSPMGLIGEQRNVFMYAYEFSPLAVGRGDAAPRYANVCGLKPGR